MVRSARRHIGIATLLTAVVLGATGAVSAATASAQVVPERPASIALPTGFQPTMSASAVGIFGFAAMMKFEVRSQWVRPTGTVTVTQGSWVVARGTLQPSPNLATQSIVTLYGLHDPGNTELTFTYSGGNGVDGGSITRRVWY